MTPLEDLDRLLAGEGLTPRPWSKEGLASLLRYGGKSDGYWDEVVSDNEYMPQCREDAALIVAAVSALPGLIAEVRAGRLAIERLQEIERELGGLKESAAQMAERMGFKPHGRDPLRGPK